MARWVSETKQRMVIVFEGRDTAGKGGSIDMFARVLNPRQCRVVALPAPNERERTQWYFQRYVEHFPAEGEIVLFDRSWYNRAGRRDGDGLLHARRRLRRSSTRCRSSSGSSSTTASCCSNIGCAATRTCRRSVSSIGSNNPMKRWKLSPIDIKARAHYDEYTEAREHMLAATHTDFAPWTLVDFNDQPVGRLTLLRDLFDRVPDTELPLDEIPWPALPHEPLQGALHACWSRSRATRRSEKNAADTSIITSTSITNSEAAFARRSSSRRLTRLRLF